MNRRPSITVSYAQSLDGCIATAGGSSQWISGDQTLELAHQLRNEHDAVMVGSGTVLADDPLLTCRIPGGRTPLRVVLDSSLRTSPASKLVRTAGEYPTVIYCSSSAADDKVRDLESAGVTVIAAPESRVGVSIPWVLGHLDGRGPTRVQSLLVEGGAGVITSLFGLSLVDRLILVSAPMVIGGGISAVGDLGIQELGRAPRGRTSSVTRMGEDIVWEISFGQPSPEDK